MRGNEKNTVGEYSEKIRTVKAVRTVKKKKNAVRQRHEVQVIPATIGVAPEGNAAPQKRVAAYCRVSTDQDAQATSFTLQVQHYTEYISAHTDWKLVKIYADEGISGTQVKHRENFLEMIEDCKAGKIDMVITKSISRFARNVVDCLTYLRQLKSMVPPVEVYFEKERLSSLDDKTDMVLSLMASIAQEESRSISANIRWAYRNRMRAGTQKIPTNALLGYDTDESGEMVVVGPEAKTIQMIYKSFTQGVHPSLIATRLNSFGLKTVYGNSWTNAAVRSILQNEKYCGDVLMQKTITVDYLTHKCKMNEGEAEKFYMPNHHDAIVSREMWNKAQEIFEKTSWKRWKQRNQIRLTPVKRGLLAGFIPISENWKEVSQKRLESACKKVPAILSNQAEHNNGKHESEEIIMDENSVLAGFEELNISSPKSDSRLTVTDSTLKFNKATAAELGYPAYIRVLLNTSVKKMAIQSCTEKATNAIAFSHEKEKQSYAIVLKVPTLQVWLRKMLPEMEIKTGVTFKGELFTDESVIIYNLADGLPIKRRKRKGAPEDAQTIEAETVKSE